MRIIEVKKQEQNGTITISFRFNAKNQLFDETDPRPLPDTELTEEAEAALFSYVDEFVPKKSLELVIDLPGNELLPSTETLIPQAIQRHFALRIPDLKHELKLTRQEGTISFLLMLITMIAGILFVLLELPTILTLSASFAQTNSVPPEAYFIIFIAFILMIANWVTFWATLELFMYDYRDLHRKIRIYKKITRIPIIARGYTSEPAAI